MVLGKVRLFVRVREQGCRIESVPLNVWLSCLVFVSVVGISWMVG